MKTEVNLLEEKDLREQCIKHLEVLNAAKKLFLMPELEMLTTQQVADYYEVNIEVIQKCYQRNKLEIDPDGVAIKTISNLRNGHYVQAAKARYYADFKLSDDIVLRVPNSGIRMFSQRAILRLGMLLRDSEIAKKVRTELLNVFLASSNEQKISAINEEEVLISAIGRAWALGTKDDVMYATKGYIDFQNRHINKLKKYNDKLKPCANAYETLMNSQGWQKADAVAKSFGISRTELFKVLRDENIVTKQSGFNLPYQKYVDVGYFKVRQGENHGYNYSYTVFSPKGINFVNNLLSKEGR